MATPVRSTAWLERVSRIQAQASAADPSSSSESSLVSGGESREDSEVPAPADTGATTQNQSAAENGVLLGGSGKSLTTRPAGVLFGKRSSTEAVTKETRKKVKSSDLKESIAAMMENRRETIVLQTAALEQTQALATVEHKARMEELERVAEHAAKMRTLQIKEKELDIAVKQAQLDLLLQQLAK